MKSLSEFVAFDLETTGLSPETDSIIEIGAVKVRDGEMRERFSVVVKPRTPVSVLARHLTGITVDELAAGSEPVDALLAFLTFAGTSPLVAHNAEFDANFLKAELTRSSLAIPNFTCYDSLVICRMAWPLWPNHKLETVAKRLDLPVTKAHRALPDAEWAAQAWVLAEHALKQNPIHVAVLNAVLAEAPAPWAGLAETPSTTHWEMPWTTLAREARSPKAAFPESWSQAGGSLDQALNASLNPSGKDLGPWPDRLLAELTRALTEAKWASLETSDPRSYALTLASAVLHASRTGKSVLVVVPDARGEDALVGAAQEAVRKALGGSWRLQVLREPDGYISPSRLGYLGKELRARFNASERLNLLPVLAWALATTTGDLVSFPGVSSERGRPLGLKVGAGGYGPDEPFAHAAHQLAASAEVIVVRHETFLRDLELDGALIPSVDGVLVLDANRLPELIESVSGREVSFFRVRHVLHTVAVSVEDPSGLAGWLLSLLEAGSLPSGLGDAIRGLAEKSNLAEKSTQRWLSKIGRQIEKRPASGESRVRYREHVAMEFASPETPVLEALQSLQDDLASLSEAIGNPHGSPVAAGSELALVAQECTKTVSRLGELKTLFVRLAVPHEGEVAWVEDFQNPHKIRLRVRSLEAPNTFAEKLTLVHRTGVFLGATLSLGDGTQKYFARRVGISSLDPAPRYFVESPVAGERLALVTTFTPSPQNADSAKPLGEIIARALAEIVVPTVLFAPSLGALKTLRDTLTRLLPNRAIFTQGADGHRDALTYLFGHEKAPILLGQEWPANLVDSEGQAPQLVIIARIPFAPPSDPMIAARSDMAQAEGKHPLFEILVPEAATRIKELVQRQRKPRLKQVIWYLDPRVSREKYGAFLVKGVVAETRFPAQESELVAATREWLSL